MRLEAIKVGILETANTLVSATSNGTYFRFINFPAAGMEFKYTQNRNWDVNWGDNGADGTLEPNGSNYTFS